MRALFDARAPKDQSEHSAQITWSDEEQMADNDDCVCGCNEQRGLQINNEAQVEDAHFFSEMLLSSCESYAVKRCLNQ